jgi:hypothetical protein
MKKIFLFLSLALLGGLVAYAQPRPAPAAPPDITNTPDIYEARYEGGIFGSTGKQKGTLKFDDANSRVIFIRKEDGREMFAIPYEALIILYPDSKEGLPQSGNVLTKVPVPGFGLFGLMSKSTKYANMTFEDPDVNVNGTASFRFGDKKNLLAFIDKLGVKARLTRRGDAYYRPKKAVF